MNKVTCLNGSFQADLSIFHNSPKGLYIADLKNLSGSTINQICTKYFAKELSQETQGFLLYVEDHAFIDIPLQIIHDSSSDQSKQSKVLIYLGLGANLKLSVTDRGPEDQAYFSDIAVEAILDKGSRLKLDKIQDESKLASRSYKLHVQQKQDSYFEFNGFGFGSQISRDDIEVELLEQGAEANVSGLFIVNANRESYHNVSIRHKSGHTKSEELFKGLLYDNARAAFTGLIDISKSCPQVKASQLNRNLLLSPFAHMESSPQLNILSDDVKANHGSSTGKLNEEELFYLQSRGLNSEEAQIVLMYSFCKEIINKVELESARDYISKLAVKNLSSNIKVNLDNKSVIKKCLTHHN